MLLASFIFLHKTSLRNIDKDIPAGNKWRLEITKAISKCKAVLYFVSNNSINSTECAIELELATKLNKKIIPIILEDCNLTKEINEVTSANLKRVNELQWIYLEDIYKLFNVLKNKPLTVIELTVLFNSLMLLIIMALTLIN